MNRRHFLALLGTAAAVAAIDPDRLLWEPGKTTHILPPARGWPSDMKVGDPGWMHPSSPVAQRLHAQYREGVLSREPGFEWYVDPETPPWPFTQESLDASVKALADKIDADAAEYAFAKIARERFENANAAYGVLTEQKLREDFAFLGSQWPAMAVRIEG